MFPLRPIGHVKVEADLLAEDTQDDEVKVVLDPELIKRTTRWRSEERGEGPDWADVCAGVDAVLPDSGLRQRLRELGGRMFDLPATLSELGVDTDIVAAREPAIASTAAALGRV